MPNGKLVFLFILFDIVLAIEKGQFKATQENLILDYLNKSILTVSDLGVYKLNRTTNALKCNFTVLTELDEFTVISAKAYKFLSNTYRLTAIQFAAPLKMLLRTRHFDLDTLCKNYTKPPLVWPLKVKVPYAMRGWVPDSAKFPPHFLEGRWKAQMSGILKNKAKMFEVSWYIKTEYIIPWE